MNSGWFSKGGNRDNVFVRYGFFVNPIVFVLNVIHPKNLAEVEAHQESGFWCVCAKPDFFTRSNLIGVRNFLKLSSKREGSIPSCNASGLHHRCVILMAVAYG